MDHLQQAVSKLVERETQNGADSADTFYKILDLAHDREPAGVASSLLADRQRAPRLTESWFC